MKLNTTPIYNIRATKGFSLNDELQAWDGVPEEPTDLKAGDEECSYHPDVAELKDFYAGQEEIAHSAEAQERETFDTLLKYALRGASKSTPVSRSKKPRVICMSELPRDMQKELANYVGFRGA